MLKRLWEAALALDDYGKAKTTEYIGKTNPNNPFHSHFGVLLKLIGQTGRKNLQEGLCTGKNRSFLIHIAT